MVDACSIDELRASDRAGVHDEASTDVVRVHGTRIKSMPKKNNAAIIASRRPMESIFQLKPLIAHQLTVILPEIG